MSGLVSSVIALALLTVRLVYHSDDNAAVANHDRRRLAEKHGRREGQNRDNNGR